MQRTLRPYSNGWSPLVEAGLTVSGLLREATRLASRPSVDEWLARTRRRPSRISRAEVVEVLDEIRGARPEWA